MLLSTHYLCSKLLLNETNKKSQESINENNKNLITISNNNPCYTRCITYSRLCLKKISIIDALRVACFD